MARNSRLVRNGIIPILDNDVVTPGWSSARGPAHSVGPSPTSARRSAERANSVAVQLPCTRRITDSSQPVSPSQASASRSPSRTATAQLLRSGCRSVAPASKASSFAQPHKARGNTLDDDLLRGEVPEGNLVSEGDFLPRNRRSAQELDAEFQAVIAKCGAPPLPDVTKRVRATTADVTGSTQGHSFSFSAVVLHHMTQSDALEELIAKELGPAHSHSAGPSLEADHTSRIARMKAKVTAMRAMRSKFLDGDMKDEVWRLSEELQKSRAT